jgi:hypothetical protein
MPTPDCDTIEWLPKTAISFFDMEVFDIGVFVIRD